MDELVALQRNEQDGKVHDPQWMANEKGHRVPGRKDVAEAVARVVHPLVLRTELVGLELSGVQRAATGSRGEPSANGACPGSDSVHSTPFQPRIFNELLRPPGAWMGRDGNLIRYTPGTHLPLPPWRGVKKHGPEQGIFNLTRTLPSATGPPMA